MIIVFTSSERIVVPILLSEYRQSLLILFPALPALPYFNLFLPYNLFGFSGKSKLFPLSFIRPVFSFRGNSRHFSDRIYRKNTSAWKRSHEYRTIFQEQVTKEVQNGISQGFFMGRRDCREPVRRRLE
jgi:hypothetical protein